MKRRLTRAYDHMTMPDRCTHRIEQKLNEQMQQKHTGRYTKAIPPAPVRRRSWAAAMAAVCLVLVLSVGGTTLFLNLSATMRMQSHLETVAMVQESEPTAVPGDYSLVTAYSAEGVEDFAKTVRYDVINEDWEALAKKIHYPITIQDQRIQTPAAFLVWMDYSPPSMEFRQAVAGESCTGMFCNWQGICMANGEIWINEIDGRLQVTAFNLPVTEEEEESQQKKVPMEFAGVLTGGTAHFTDREEKMTIEDYCGSFWDDTGVLMEVKAFTVVDMDDDGVSEVVLHLVMQGTTDRDGDGISETEEEADYGFMVLRLEDGTVYGYPFRYGQMYDLKKDGSFGWAGNGPQQGESRLTFEGKGVYHQSFQETGPGEKSPVQWHSYPCLRPELVLQSYEYVMGDGWTRMPGSQYYHFEGLILGSMGNLWELQKEQLLRYGMICLEDEGTVTVFDPDAPGTALYGTLTNETGEVQFSELGFYICTEEKEYVAEARGLLTGEPEYWADAHLPFLGTMGRMVSTPEELTAYFGYTLVPDEETMQQTKELRDLIGEITAAYLAGGSEAMEPYLAETYQNREKKFFPKDAVIKLMTYSFLPERVMEVGETLYVNAGVRLAEDDRDYSFNLDLVKQKDGWKVEAYYLYSSED